MLIKEVRTLLKKEILLEWRHKYAINGILLYSFSTIFICYMSFEVLKAGLNIYSWNALFWIIMLFTAVSAVSKSFVQENKSRQLYYFNLVSPQGIIISKILYNSGLLVFLSLIGYSTFSLVLGNPVQDQLMFMIIIILAAIGFSITFTLTSGIASKAENNGTLMAILSFPIIIPMVLMVVKISRNAIDGLDRGESMNEVLTLLSINLIVGTLAYVLFPYLWRS